MNSQLHIQNILNKKLLEFRVKNPAFSVRALARKIDLQPSATNEILKGKRRVSYEMAEKIATKLLLDPTEKMNLMKDFPQKLNRKSKNKLGKEQELSQVKLSTQQFELISDWSHYAILNLIETKNFIQTPEAIAERLAITPKKAQETLNNLINLNLVHYEDGILKRTFRQTNTVDDVRNLSLQKMHIADMEMAKEKLSEVDVKLRDFTSYTLAFDINLLPKVKELIRKFQDDVDELMSEAKPTEVYKMNTYIYPLTKLDNSYEQRIL